MKLQIPARPAPLIVAIALVVLASAGAHGQQRTVDQFFDSFTAEWMRGNPNAVTSTRYFTGEAQNRLERQVTPLTPEYRRERARLARRGLAELRRFDRSAMTDAQRVSAQLMEWQLDTIASGEAFDDLAFPLEQFGGVNVTLVNALTVNHPLRTEADADNYLARLALVGTRMGEAIADARRIAARGTIPPRFILDATVTQLRQFISGAPGQNPFVTAFDERLRAARGVPEARRGELRAAAEKIVASQIYPAWRSAIALLQEQLPLSTNDAGLWRLKGGDAAYAHHLRRFTTTSLTADQIHEIGLREVARIETEMDAILRRLGRAEGTVKDRVEQLRSDLAYPLSEQGRTAIMTDIESIMRDAEKRAALLFDRRPRSGVIAQPYPRFREANAAASYNAPPLDGSRPGVFQMPLRPDQMTKFRLRSLVYHETVPGHHFHIALGQEDESLPRFRRIRAFGTISAITEGWALYAERLTAESGWYEGDPEGLLGQLDSALFRARRLVVDTGLHAKRWTRQQAIDYGIEPSEVERYVVNPGQACAYMIGQLKIVELREQARAALGPRFSLQDFHNVVLGAGTVPLQILEAEVDRYIRES
ncbi:MAG TPA: DUF885 domain-containing protein [Vicinamibacterales bacterium]